MITPIPLAKELACIFLISGALFLSAPAAIVKPDADVARFIAAKRQQVEQSARQCRTVVPSEVRQMFDAAAAANWYSTSNLFNTIIGKYKPVEQGEATNRLPPEVWYPIQEVGGFCEMFTFTDPKYMRLFADEIFKVVPPGSVFFGGTDPGRFIITALSSSHAEGKPFFTITQNQLVATNYLKYVKEMYGKQLQLPASETIRKAFDDYLEDANRRLAHDQKFPDEPKQIQPGENVRLVDNRVQVSGDIAVMAVNGLVAKAILNDNTNREFYIEESFALDWMYPYLVPIGPIFKLQHTRLEGLPKDCLMADRQYWAALTRRLLGFTAQEDTPMDVVCTFAEHPNPQRGEQGFLRDRQARNTFAKLRSASANLYAWYSSQGIGSVDRRRCGKEAELAFKQAYCLSPSNPETIWRFAMFLHDQKRLDDIQTFLDSARKMNPGDAFVADLLKWSKSNR